MNNTYQQWNRICTLSLANPFNRFASILIRCMGLAVIANALHMFELHMEHDGPLKAIQNLLSFLPVSRFAMVLSSISLVIFGPIRLLLFALASSTVWGFYDNATQTDQFALVEFFILFILPLFLCFISVSGDQRSSLPVETEKKRSSAALLLFQLSAIINFTFIGLHKINSDFLDVKLSCANLLGSTMLQSLSLPRSLSFVHSPWVIITLEIAIPIVLLLSPRIGVLITGFLTIGFLSVGAFQVALLMFICTVGFLNIHASKFFIPKPTKSIVVVLFITTSLTVVYSQTQPNLRTFIFSIATFMVTYWMAICIGGKSLSHQNLAGIRSIFERWRPLEQHQKVIILFFAGILCLNNFSPYLGIKFNYSGAMHSNLRADSNRWNSLWAPKWARIFPNDKYFVAITSVEKVRQTGSTKKRPRTFQAAFAHVSMVKKKFKKLLHRQELKKSDSGSPDKIQLKFEYLSQKYEFDAYDDRQSLLEFIENLPKGNNLFQKRLAFNRPQSCIH